MSTSSKYPRTSARGIVAGAVLALGLVSSALAQTGSPPENVVVAAPKQVAAWTVTGWSRGYCSARRPLPGVAGGGATLQLALTKLRIGYRITLSAEEWELKPWWTFPIEVIADPVLQTDANATAFTPKLVFIELGADAQFVKKLVAAPMIEIKASHATFMLPMDGIDEALAELETCFGALKQPTANPFARPSTP
jgi:hypothetical protein